MKRENKKKSFEKGYFKTHACQYMYIHKGNVQEFEAETQATIQA